MIETIVNLFNGAASQLQSLVYSAAAVLLMLAGLISGQFIMMIAAVAFSVLSLISFFTGVPMQQLLSRYISTDTPKIVLTVDRDELDLSEDLTVTFRASADDAKAPGIGITVYDSSHHKVVSLHDDGQNGDDAAGDGVYTAIHNFAGSEARSEDYHAEQGFRISNPVTILFYRKIAENEFADFTEIVNAAGERSFEEAEAYLSGLEEIEYCEADDAEQIIEYRSRSGLYGLWAGELKKGSGDYSLPASEGADFEKAIELLRGLNCVSAAADPDISVLRPFRSTEFQYDQFRDAGIALQTALGGELSVIDDEDVTMDVMKHLDDSGAILIDTHGTLHHGKNYILIGEELDEARFLLDGGYYMQHAAYTSDYLTGRIYCVSFSRDGQNFNRISVGDKFFKKYYGSNSLDGSFWFLGNCYGMYNDSIAEALTNAGAEAVAGYSDTVSVGYCNNTLFETVVNRMLLAADTFGNGFASAVQNYGETDPVNPACRYRMYGDENFRFLDAILEPQGEITGMVCEASDMTTPIRGARVRALKDGAEAGTASTDESGSYRIPLEEGEYSIEISAPDHISFRSNASVKEEEMTYMETFLMVTGESGQEGTTRGRIVDAVTGQTVSGIRLTVYEGWNMRSGNPVAQTSTDRNGNYSLTLPIGNYTILEEGDGYVASLFNVVVQESETYREAAINPVSDEDIFRVVLTWGLNPSDLDSHMTGTLSDGGTFHVYFDHKNVVRGNVNICNLDVDDTTSYGPETTTLRASGDRPYYFFVHKYAGSGTVAASGAQLRIYRGSELLQTMNVPSGGGGGIIWNAFAIKNGELMIRNTITSEPELSYAD